VTWSTLQGSNNDNAIGQYPEGRYRGEIHQVYWYLRLELNRGGRGVGGDYCTTKRRQKTKGNVGEAEQMKEPKRLQTLTLLRDIQVADVT